MSAVAEKARVTADEFLAMSDQEEFELIDGEILPRHGNPLEGGRMGVLSSWVGTNLARLLGNHIESARLGWVFGSDNGFQCFPDRPESVRRPDVSFVGTGRMDWDQIGEGWLHVVPDLVVEVVSPNDRAYEVEDKVEMFLKAGVPLIWVVNPKVRTVRILRGDGSTAILRESNDLSGEDVIPGFSCPVAAIFPPNSTSIPPTSGPTP